MMKAGRVAIDCILEDQRWSPVGLEAIASDCFRVTLRHLSLEIDSFDVALLACNDDRIVGLNSTYRDKPQPTNVLSWPTIDLSAKKDGDHPDRPSDEEESLGDVALAYETCLTEADSAGKPFEHHLRHLIVHGLLHLLGYDHIRDADAALMEGLERQILGKMGLPDPYLI